MGLRASGLKVGEGSLPYGSRPEEILHRRWFKVGLVSRDGVEGLRGLQ